jgi:hypothetical protein
LRRRKKIKSSKKSNEKKQKQLEASYDCLMVRQVQAEAIRLQTGCIHHEPFSMSEETTSCPLHMDTNEYLRVLERIVHLAATLTLAHWDT